MLYEFKELARELPKKRRELCYYIAGLTDGEGCFSVSIKKQNHTRFGYVIDPVFHIVQGEKGRKILEVIKEVLKAGRVEKKHGQDEWQFIVDNRRQLKEKVIPFFNKYKLIIKREEFQRFAEIVEMLERKEHWKKEGFIKILKLAYKTTKQGRKRTLREVLASLKERESSEAIRRGPSRKGENP